MAAVKTPAEASVTTIVLSGGGSGGHITPVLAVARALKQRRPDIRLIYIIGKGDKLADVLQGQADIDAVHEISAGKWRRYHGEGWRQLFDIRTLLKNLRDVGRLIIGIWQAWRLLGKLQPNGVFIKGGFVGVPIGWAARWRNIPYVTHDSDVIPGLANRLIAKHAAAHAVGMPKEFYSYPKDKTFYTGVPIAAEYVTVTPAEQAAWRSELGIAAYAPVILAAGGGLGAQNLNEAIANLVPRLLQAYPQLALLHIVGRDHEASMRARYAELLDERQRPQVIVRGFVTDGYRYSAVADLVVARAGATSLVEYAAQAKACIIVPNPLLTSGHQLKNAEQLASHGAAEVVAEDQLQSPSDNLFKTIKKLLAAPAQRTALGKALQSFARPKAADELAKLLLQTFKVTPKDNETTT